MNNNNAKLFWYDLSEDQIKGLLLLDDSVVKTIFTQALMGSMGSVNEDEVKLAWQRILIKAKVNGIDIVGPKRNEELELIILKLLQKEFPS